MKVVRFLLLACLALAAQSAFSQNQMPAAAPGQTLYRPLDESLFPEWSDDLPQFAKLILSGETEFDKIEEAFEKFERQLKGKNHRKERTERERELAGEVENVHEVFFHRWKRAYYPFVNDEGKIALPSVAEFEQRIQAQNAGAAQKMAAANWVNVGPRETHWLKNDNSAQPPCPWQVNIYAFDIAKSNTSILFAGPETGGIWKTVDKGLNWTECRPDINFGGTAGCVRIHPSDPNTVYVGIGTFLWKTTDGGSTWADLTTCNASDPRDIAISPADPNIVMVAASNGFFRSTNGGTSWTQVFTQSSYDIEINPSDATHVFLLKVNSTKVDFYKSTDSGASFSLKTTGITTLTAGRLTVTAANSNRLYALCTSNPNPPKLLISSDEGETWTDMAATFCTGGISDAAGGQGFYDLSIAASQTDANQLLFGLCTTSKAVSTDGGATFTYSNIGGYCGSFPVHPDLQEVRCVLNGAALETWVATDGGLTFSTDFFSNASNAEARNNGIYSTDFWGFQQGWNEDILVGGRYHNGNTAMADFYPAGKALRMGGAEAGTGYMLHGNPRQAVFSDIDGAILPSNFYANGSWFAYAKYPNEDDYGWNSTPLVVHPKYFKTHFLGNGNVFWKTTDNGATFTSLHDFGSPVRRFAIARSNPQVVYLATDAGFNKSTNGGATWTAVALPAGKSPGNLYLAIHPTNEQELWICFKNVSATTTTGKVYKSTDGGATWVDQTATGLVGSKVKEPVHTGGGVYLASDSGNGKVFYRANSASAWTEISTNLPASMQILRIIPFYRDGKLRVGGDRGAWETPLEEAVAPVALACVDRPTSDCPRDTFFFEDYSIVQHAGASWSWDFPGATTIIGAATRNPKVVYGNPGNYTATMTLTTPSGTQTSTVSVTVNAGCTPDTIPGQVLRTAANEDKFLSTQANLTNLTHFTVTGWWKPNGAQQAYAALFSSGDWCAHCDYTEGLIFDYGGTKLWYKWPGNASNWGSNSGITIPLNEWSYVALVITPAGATMYLNDKKYFHSKALSPGEIEHINIGYGHYSKSFKGDIDEVTIWKRALSDDEVRALRHITRENVIPGDPDLIGYWQFNELVNGQVQDNAGTHHGSLVQGAVLAASTAPVGGGAAQLMPLTNSQNVYDFDDAGAKIYMTDCVDKSGSLVATRLNLAPNVAPNGNPTAANTWFLNYYGASTTFTRFDSLELTPTDASFLSNLGNADEAVLHLRPENSDAANWSPKAKALNINGSKIAWNRKTNITAGTQIALSDGAPAFSETDPGAMNCTPEPFPGTLLESSGTATGFASSPTAPQFGASQDFSISVWFKTTSTVTDGVIFSNKDWDSGANDGWVFSLTSGKIWWNVGDGSNRIDQKPTTPVLNDGKWHIFTATCDRDGLSSIYVDGKFIASTSMSAIGDINNVKKLSLGADDEDDYRIAAQIEEACVYDRVLSQNEIRELAHLTRTGAGATSGLVSYFQFNNTGATEFDRAGNYNLTLGAAASRSVSSAPIGGGSASRLSVTSAGVKDFAGADAMLAFAAGTLPNGEVVVSKIQNFPNALPTCSAWASDTTYWIIDNYGTNVAFAALDSARFGGIQVPSTDDIPATSYLLRQRTSPNEHLNNWATKPSSSIAAQGGNPGWVKFGAASQITSGGQFLMINTLAAQIISGPNMVCSGASATLDAGAGFTTYAWSNGGGTGQTATFTNITAPTTFFVTVTNASGCTGIAQKIVSVGGSASTTIAGPSSVCPGASAALDAGAGFTSYAWSNGGGTGQTATFTNLTATTTFVVTITNSSGCTGTAAKTVTVAPLSPSISGPSEVCSAGSVTLDAGAGFASYLWSNSGGTAQTATFTNITTNKTYTVTVTNAGCTGTATKSITVVAKPVVTITTPISGGCIGGSSTASVAAIPGGTYNWTVTNGTIVSGQGTDQVTAAWTTSGSKTFAVTVTNSTGCSSVKTKSMTVYAGPTLSAVLYSAGCGGASGEVNLTATAGLAPYSYVWSNAATTEDLVNVAAGTYTVTATDARTCTKAGSFTVAGGTTPPKPTSITLAYSCSPLTANLTWKGPQGGSYELRYRPSTTTVWTNVGNIGNVFAYALPGLSPNVNYYFSIRYVCPTSGFSAYVQKTGVSPNCAAALPSERDEASLGNSENTAFQLLPNPASDRVKVVFKNPETTSGEISVLNALGQTVLRRSFENAASESVLELPIGALPQGVYQVVLTAGAERFAEHLVVARR